MTAPRILVAVLLFAACSSPDWSAERAAGEPVVVASREVAQIYCGVGDRVRCMVVVGDCLGVIMRCEQETGCEVEYSTELCR